MACCLSYTAVQAQDNDMELRQQIALKYNINKKWRITAKYFLQSFDNALRFDKAVPAGEINYKPYSWLKAEVEYRFETNYRKDNSEIRYALTFDYDFNKKWKIKYRPMLQQQFEYLNREYLVANPVEYTFRNTLELDYQYNKKTDLYLFTEFYLDRDEGILRYPTQKSGGGISYVYKKRNEFNLEANWIYDREDALHTLRICVGYSYVLGYVKKKKHKGAAEPVDDSE